jgi:hypothetical protein
MSPFPGPPVVSPDASGNVPVVVQGNASVVIQGPGGINGSPLGFQSEALTNAAAVALPAIPAGTIYATVTPSVAATYRDDGVAPTSTVGVPMNAGQSYTFSGPQLATIKFIAVGVTAGTLNASYYN